MHVSKEALSRNVELFPFYRAATSVLPWLPVFFLYFLERVGLSEAVLLGSVYYFSVFLLEVPSGYCSDRFGRRPTLLLATLMTLASSACYLLAQDFIWLATAQVLLAASIAFQSGSDSALLYDSLAAVGREQEYTLRETIAQKWSMYALALSCLAGGALGLIDLRLAYALSLLAGLAALLICLRFVEPPIDIDERAHGFTGQMRLTLTSFSHPLTAWILAFFVIGFSLEHIPYEFYQPYLKLLGESELTRWLTDDSTPIISAILISISMFGGALGAALSQRLIHRMGLRTLLLTSIGIQLLITGGLSILLHPALLILVMFRNFSMSMARGPMLGAVAPHVGRAQRATFLSLMSLCGRAGFALVLAVLSLFVVGSTDLNWPALSQVLASCTLAGSVALLLLFFWSRRIAADIRLPD